MGSIPAGPIIKTRTITMSYNKFLQNLKHICVKRKFKLKKIDSVGKNREYPLFSITLNDTYNPKKIVCFSAGIHGNEIAGPLAIIRFLETFDTRQFRDIKIIIFPIENPSGFDRHKSRNYLNRDLNRHFCDKILSGENKILYNKVKNESIFFFHALHEDVDKTCFYLYNFEKKEEEIYRNVIKVAKKYFPIDTNRKIYKDKAINGLVINRRDGSFEDRMSRDGTPYSMCTETPGKKPLAKRIELNVKIMNLILNFSKSKY